MNSSEPESEMSVTPPPPPPPSRPENLLIYLEIRDKGKVGYLEGPILFGEAGKENGLFRQAPLRHGIGENIIAAIKDNFNDKKKPLHPGNRTTKYCNDSTVKVMLEDNEEVTAKILSKECRLVWAVFDPTTLSDALSEDSEDFRNIIENYILRPGGKRFNVGYGPSKTYLTEAEAMMSMQDWTEAKARESKRYEPGLDGTKPGQAEAFGYVGTDLLNVRYIVAALRLDVPK